ncbi:MAG: outer membrane protein assembly factor BamD [Rhodothermales bacterium]|nr:outer membrane protein assembly factor BamD [Rhodothermales bacterium]MBO6779038.1 outer membrane protein assembly factor BamD [Rhodothermales bacterium]
MIQRLTTLLLIVILAGCAGSRRLSYDGPEDAYNKGVERMEAEDYERAAEFFQGVFDFGRTHEWAADAQIALARAYRANGEYLLAANEFTRFTQIYRADPRVPDAAYELAMTYYDRSPRWSLDQTDTGRAITQFELFMTRYPNHPLFFEGQARIEELRGKLARKRYESGNQYATRGYNEAAALTFESVFDDYYDTEWADDALVAAARSYIAFADQSIPARRPERLQLAIDAYERLIQIFPDSPLIKEGEEVFRSATDRLRQLDGTAQ